MAKREKRTRRRERPARRKHVLGRPRRSRGNWPARARLLKVAARIFAAKGYAATSVAEIVAAAGVTKPVLYYHFKNKEGLFRGLVVEAANILATTVSDHDDSSGPVPARLRELFAAVFDAFIANLDLARFLDVVMYGPPEGTPRLDLEQFHLAIREAILGLVKDGLARWELHGRGEDFLWGLLGVLRITTETALHHPERSPGRAGMLRLVDLVANSRPKGSTR